MKTLQQRLATVEEHVKSNSVKVMIIGLGSVGSYLLDYIISKNDPAIDVVVVGRDKEKMQTKVNITRIAGLIREVNKSHITVQGGVDLNNVDEIGRVISEHKPDFIVNSSRAYPGLKYGSISWNNIRAYGIWTPLSIRFTKNIMDACEAVDTDAVVINTSYSDAVIPWLKSAGKAYPDFGSGNINHLVPRIKFAVADIMGVDDYWNVDIIFAAGHFHDVCISKEGHTEGVELPLKVYYRGMEQSIPSEQIYCKCKIPMPVDQTRNMMNASSNYQIINAIIEAIRTRNTQKVFTPGFGGNIGGYPVQIGYKDDVLDAWIDETVFGLDEMNRANRKSIELDGVEDVLDGCLIYTDSLIEKVKNAFGKELPKTVRYDEIDQIAKWLIDEIVLPQTTK